MTALELDDIQGLVARGYANLTFASYVLLQLDDPSTASAWLRGLADHVTPAPAHPTDFALNVALTPSGVRKLGLPEDVLAQFSNQFTAGMTTPHRRRMLGDLDASAPETWAWGGPSAPVPDVLLLEFAQDGDTLNRRHLELMNGATGVTEIVQLQSLVDLKGKEQFGFTDGISQPTVEGLSSRTDIPPNTIRAGEFILGYVNEYGLYTDRPLVTPVAGLPLDAEGSGKADLGRNGTYLVLRQVAQDVRGLWRYVDAATRGSDGSSDASRRTWLAARMVGRWPGGAPLTLSPDSDDPNLSQANDFTYQFADEFGLNCPIGAHVRRAHPRDSLDPNPGSAESVDLDKRHRLLRRGREYGPPVPSEDLLSDPPPDDPERGLFFVGIAANIGRQFEFIQHSWVNNPKFDGLYDEPDPLVGYHADGNANFSVPADPLRLRFKNIPNFVTTRGGGYFFLPGIRALRYLGGLQPGNTSSPVGS